MGRKRIKAVGLRVPQDERPTDTRTRLGEGKYREEVVGFLALVRTVPGQGSMWMVVFGYDDSELAEGWWRRLPDHPAACDRLCATPEEALEAATAFYQATCMGIEMRREKSAYGGPLR